MARRELLSLRAFGLSFIVVASFAACESFDETPPSIEAPPRDASSFEDANPIADASTDTSPVDAGPKKCAPTAPFGTPVALAVVNTPADEGAARLSPDELSIYLTRYISASASVDILMAVRPDRTAPFGTPVPVAAVSANDLDDIHPSLSPDGLSLYFSRRDATSWNIRVSRRTSLTAEFAPSTRLYDQAGRHELFPYATSDELWLSTELLSGDTSSRIAHAPLDFDGSAPQVVDGLQVPPYSDYAPVLSADQKTLYFSSARPGGPPPKTPNENDNIWVARRDTPSSAFSTPTLVTELSTSSRELAAWISPDDCRFYFSSTRLGSFDIYVAERAP